MGGGCGGVERLRREKGFKDDFQIRSVGLQRFFRRFSEISFNYEMGIVIIIVC